MRLIFVIQEIPIIGVAINGYVENPGSATPHEVEMANHIGEEVQRLLVERTKASRNGCTSRVEIRPDMKGLS